ncbi:HNH endonuclease [Paracoccus sp. pheM1]|uniref:HNH endonuclease n=1 Tax=Paracoccus sp. pheM1 TaxID=2831675 RepID=UPI001BDB8C48|nr:HNH endonuclease [Paracoccus sp. pheM1]MBT0780540.1 HNH endonuclease [Paracoccus sp. pheM1]
MNQIAPAILRQLLRYDAQTGKLFWRQRGSEWFKQSPRRSRQHACANWNSRYAGSEAFTAMGDDGYLRGRVLGTAYLAHRVIWALETGEWPQEQIDHSNGDRADNRRENLREATPSENTRNRSVQSNSKSGVKGVSWEKRRGKWRSTIKLHGKQTHLGQFDTIEAARAAYDAAVYDVHGKFARSNP